MKEEKGTAFVIMQIGNNELDELYDNIYIPSIKAAGLIPKRIDRDNEGSLLKKEIIEQIEKADIIIADLTNERPNCYLEVGYAMGLDKFKNLIFTIREDHYMGSDNYKKGGPKIHFDVSGYETIFWESDKLDDFKSKLIDKINIRLSIINSKKLNADFGSPDKLWIKTHQEYVQEKLKERSFSRYFEAFVSPKSETLNIPQNELLNIADSSQIDTFGWPIAVVFKNVPEFKPISKTDGIMSEIFGTSLGNTYDYTYFRKNGQIFITKSLFEETHHKGIILIEVRIKRITEFLMYLLRFYSRCNLQKSEKIEIRLKYSGFSDNQLAFVNSGFFFREPKVAKDNDFEYIFDKSIAELENSISATVHDIAQNFFLLFDFFKISYASTKEIVDNFIIETRNARR